MAMNDLIKYLFVALAVSLISVTSSAITVEGKLTTSPIGNYIYESVLDHKEEVVYEQNDANVPVQKKINNDVKADNLNSVAGKDINGYSKLILKKIDEKTVAIEGDRKEYHSGSDAAELKYAVTGSFRKGSWSDLINDKEVIIIFSTEASPIIKRSLKSYLEKVIKNIGNKVLAEMSKGSLKQKVQASAVGSFVRAEVINEKLKINMVALEGSKKRLTQSFSLDTAFKLHNK